MNRDEVIKKFLKETENIQTRFINQVQLLITNNKISNTDLARLVAQIDFYQELTSLGYETSVSRFMRQYDTELASLIRTARSQGLTLGSFDISMFDTIQKLDTKLLLGRASNFADEYKSALLKSILTTDRQTLVNNIFPLINETIPFKPNWFEAVVNQSFTAYYNTATAQIYAERPETKFRLIHPVDKVTRPLCQFAIQRMEQYPDGLTIEQINSGKLNEGFEGKYPSQNTIYSFENLGGFNCRGFWEVVSIG
jgi:hypothetical protein